MPGRASQFRRHVHDDVVRPLVLKFGGELLEDPERLHGVVERHSRASPASTPLAIVHGGGKEIDAALKAAGIEKRQIEGLRITDEPTLAVVVSVLAGAINTRFVAALATAGVGAVGLTGADASCGLSDVAPPHRTVDGRVVALGAVGIPAKDADMRVLHALLGGGFVPVLACIGLGRDGRLFNVNADTFAGHLASRLHARRLVIAGTTAGVLGADGTTIAELNSASMARLLADEHGHGRDGGQAAGVRGRARRRRGRCGHRGWAGRRPRWPGQPEKRRRLARHVSSQGKFSQSGRLVIWSLIESLDHWNRSLTREHHQRSHRQSTIKSPRKRMPIERSTTR